MACQRSSRVCMHVANARVFASFLHPSYPLATCVCLYLLIIRPCMYVCMHVCMCASMDMHACTHAQTKDLEEAVPKTCTHAQKKYLSLSLCTYTHICTCMHVCACTHAQAKHLEEAVPKMHEESLERRRMFELGLERVLKTSVHLTGAHACARARTHARTHTRAHTHTHTHTHTQHTRTHARIESIQTHKRVRTHNEFHICRAIAACGNPRGRAQQYRA